MSDNKSVVLNAAGKNVELDLDEFDARTRYAAREGRRTKLRTK